MHTFDRPYRRATILPCLLLLVTILAACGAPAADTGAQTDTASTAPAASATASEAAAESTAAEPSAVAESEAAAPAGDTIKLTFLKSAADGSPKEVALLKQYMQEHPGVEVELQEIPFAEYADHVTTAFAGGSMPDILLVPNVNAGQTWAQTGMLLELDDFLANSDIKADNYFEYAWKPGVLDGKVYGLPQSIDTRALAYNTKLFEEAGLKPPTNWDEMIAAAKALTVDTDGDGAVDQYGIAPECGGKNEQCYVYDFGMFLVGNGGYIVSPDGNECWANKPEAVEAVEIWKQLEPTMPTGWFNMTSELADLFAQGKVGMIIAGPWYVDNVPKANPDMKLGDTWDIAPWPGSGKQGAPEYAATMGGWMWSIGANTEHADAAWDVLQWMQAPDRVAEYTSALPTGPTVGEEPRFGADYYQDVYIPKMLPNSRPPAGLSPAVLEIYKLESDAVQQAVVGDKTAQQAMDDLCGQVTPLLSQ